MIKEENCDKVAETPQMFTCFKKVSFLSASEHDYDASGGFVPEPNQESCADICFVVWKVLHPQACQFHPVIIGLEEVIYFPILWLWHNIQTNKRSLGWKFSFVSCGVTSQGCHKMHLVSKSLWDGWVSCFIPKLRLGKNSIRGGEHMIAIKGCVNNMRVCACTEVGHSFQV